jgi:hypothetical protein
MQALKKTICAILIAAIMLGVTGCMSSNSKASTSDGKEEIAQKLLKAKYNEEFVVYKTYGGSYALMGHSFKAVCSPKNQPNLKFEVEALKDGSGIVVDEYISRKISASVEEILINNLSKTVSNFTIKVGAGSKTINSADANMTISDYLKMKRNAGFSIYIVIDQTCLSNIKAEKLYSALNNMFTNLPEIDGGMEVYFASNDIVQQIKKYTNDHANVDAGFDNILKNCKMIDIPVTKSKLGITLEDYASKLK